MTPKSTEVAVADVPQLPALINPNAEALGNIDSGDIALPRLYKGEYQSALVQDDTVPKGCIFVAAGADDPDPQVVYKLGDEQGVLVHVLSAFKGKSAKVDGDFKTFKFDDPEAPENADVDFHYVVVLPEVDPDVPVKLTMSKTSVPAARKINFLLLKNQAEPTYNLAFRLNTVPREKSADGQKFKWFVWQGRQVPAVAEHVEVAAQLAEMIASAPVRNDINQTASTAPAI